MCEEPCLAAPDQQVCFSPPRQTLLPPCWLPLLQYLERRAFPLGLRPSVVLGSRFNEPVSGRPHPRTLPKDRLQDSAVASRSFHCCFLFLPRYFPPCVTLSLCWAFVYLALILFFFPFSRVSWHCGKVCALGLMEWVQMVALSPAGCVITGRYIFLSELTLGLMKWDVLLPPVSLGACELS